MLILVEVHAEHPYNQGHHYNLAGSCNDGSIVLDGYSLREVLRLVQTQDFHRSVHKINEGMTFNYCVVTKFHSLIKLRCHSLPIQRVDASIFVSKASIVESKFISGSSGRSTGFVSYWYLTYWYLQYFSMKDDKYLR